jgi:DNA (cytosine-5)-methyltransferase 1
VTRPRLLDLYCGAGGAAVGYHRAGFNVTGVDIAPQPRYPFEFCQGDAMTWPLDGYDAIHASPPCQDHSRSHKPCAHGTGWMLAATRRRLQATGLPWVIENVPGAPMRADLRLCGCMFGLRGLMRERWFETHPPLFELRAPCYHPDPVITVSGTGAGVTHQKIHATFADWRRIMGIDWMTGAELAQAIPPAYTEYLGRQLLGVVTGAQPGRRLT